MLKKASFTTVLKTVTVGIVNDTVLELAFSRTVIEIVNVINAPNTLVILQWFLLPISEKLACAKHCGIDFGVGVHITCATFHMRKK